MGSCSRNLWSISWFDQLIPEQSLTDSFSVLWFVLEWKWFQTFTSTKQLIKITSFSPFFAVSWGRFFKIDVKHVQLVRLDDEHEEFYKWGTVSQNHMAFGMFVVNKPDCTCYCPVKLTPKPYCYSFFFRLQNSVYFIKKADCGNSFIGSIFKTTSLHDYLQFK